MLHVAQMMASNDKISEGKVTYITMFQFHCHQCNGKIAAGYMLQSLQKI